MPPHRSGILLITTLLLNACAQPAPGMQVCSGEQIIITFEPDVNAMHPDFTAGLSTDSGMPIQYMRHLFGGHHLYCVQPGTHVHSLDDALQRLQERTDIKAVEIDRRKHPGADH